MERLFVDTSAWLSYIHRDDASHKKMKRTLRKYEGRLVTSNYVFDETVTLCQRRLGFPTALLVGDLLRADAADLVRVTADDERIAWELFGERADKGYSFTDCTSFALMRRLGLERAATLDADFAQEGFLVEPREP